MTYLAFVRKERRLLTFALSFTFFSSFGQTFLISLFVPYFITAFELSNAGFGSLYSIATLVSATALPWLGQWIDRIPLKQYSLYVATGLLIASLTMAVSWHISILFVSLVLLRLSGQGLSGHTAQTTMARFHDRVRGKALSISGLGYPLGEALLPSAVAGLLIIFHWRTTWLLIASVIAVVFIPVLWYLVRKETGSVESESEEEEAASTSEQYKLLMKDPRTAVMVPAILMPPFWVTGLFLYQVSAADDLGWSAALIASAFVAFAATRIFMGLSTGPVIDRFSAQSLFPTLLIPMIAGCLIGYFYSGAWAAFVYMGLTGATMGFSGTLKSSLLAELYGTRTIGTVQSLFSSLMVFSTALSPFLVGWLLDNAVSMNTLLLIAALTSTAAALLSIRVMPQYDP